MLGVFLGPEWFFKRVPRAYTDTEREQIVALVERLSVKYPKLLIIPGSIIWRKAGSGPHGRFRKKAEMGNLAPVVFNGRCIHRVEKEINAGDTAGYALADEKDSDINTKVKSTREYLRHSAKLTDNTSFFKIENVKFSLEICGDHSSGKRAANELAQRPPFPGHGRADVQLLVAHGAGFVKPGSGQTVREGGVAYSVDAAPVGNSKNAFGTVTTATNTKKTTSSPETSTTILENVDKEKSFGLSTRDMGMWDL
ncbi:MAG: hypothetical protein ACRDWE_12760 [Acidimicrobiales bacterium]